MSLPAAVAHLRALAAGAAWPMQVAAVAVSDRPGHAVLQVPVLAGGPVWEWASISKDFAGMRADLPDIVEVLSLEVPVVTIDSLDLAGVTAVKLDVEGAEEAAVRGAERLLRREARKAAGRGARSCARGLDRRSGADGRVRLSRVLRACRPAAAARRFRGRDHAARQPLARQPRLFRSLYQLLLLHST